MKNGTRIRTLCSKPGTILKPSYVFVKRCVFEVFLGKIEFTVECYKHIHEKLFKLLDLELKDIF